MIDIINDFIQNGDIEKAYELIIEHEGQFSNDSKYWALRGDLCFKVQEYETAKKCYLNSFKLDNFNEYSVEKLYCLASSEDEIKLYSEILNQIKEKPDIISIIASDFKSVPKETIEKFTNGELKWFYLKGKNLINKQIIISLEEFMKNDIYKNYIIIVPFNDVYIYNVKYLAQNNILNCIVAVEDNEQMVFVYIDDKIMVNLSNDQYKKTITFNKFSAGDSNVYALMKFIPEKFKDKYKINLINGRDVFSIENKVKVPLMSIMTVGGFSTFLSYPYPQFTYNIEVGHGAVIVKSCGIMAKKYKNFAFTPMEYKNADKICVTSTLDMIIQASFTSAPENKFLMSGIPRTDTLLLSDGRKNIEKLLGEDISNKKVIFNMPTFHKHDGADITEGSSKLNNYMKIEPFDYEEFDDFLYKNNMICIMKVHHAEEYSVSSKSKKYKCKNIFFINNNDLDREELDLYEVVSGADMLITDYSSIYGDFLFMNKPIVFVNSDIEEYRKERGLTLEPYDFWTAGPKVQNQENLQKELLEYIKNPSYYKEKREELRNVFYKNIDDKSSERIWKCIDEVMQAI